MPTFIPMALSALLLCLAQPRLAYAGEARIVLQEHLGRTWKGEMLTYPLEAAKGQCHVDSVTLTGPQGAMPVQLSNVECGPDGPFVKSARLSFAVDELQPSATHTYVVRYGPQPEAKPVPGNLKVTADDRQAEAAATGSAVRLLIGERAYEKPMPASEVPGPVVSMRLGDGPWFGGSRMYGETRIQSYAAKLAASGPVFARGECLYTYEDGNTLTISLRVHGLGSTLFIETDVNESRPADGWDLLLTPGLPPLILQFPREQVKTITDARPIDKTHWKEKAIADFGPGTVTQLTPWGDWVSEQTQTDFYLKFADAERQIVVAREDPGAWVVPRDPVILDWNSRLPEKLLPMIRGQDGSLFLHVNNVSGQRKWTLGQETDIQGKFALYPRPTSTLSGPPARLNEVKDMVLSWPDGPARHPCLFLSGADFIVAGQRNPSAIQTAQNVENLRSFLSRLGDFDLMRNLIHVATQYDAIIDSNLITPEERKLLRAQMAYLAYYAASPANWSFERFYRSGNPNMTVTHTMNQGIVGCALRDHPMGRKWADYAIGHLDRWLGNEIDEKGYWIESSHYARVAVSRMIYFAIAARSAGFHDFFADPRFREVGMFYEKTLTPPDPMRRAPVPLPQGVERPPVRAGAPYGRGTRGDVWGFGGLLARATATTNPEYSRIMQWSWRECGFTDHTGDTVGGMNGLYPNRDLPVQQPNWRSESFPHLGYLLRSHVGTSAENYLLFVSHAPRSLDGEIWPADVGIISKWFARGRPIGGVFRRIPETSHVLLENRVLLACNWDPASGAGPDTGYVTKPTQDAFTSLPRLDYASAGFEVTEVGPHLLTMPKDAPAFPVRDKAGKAPFHWQRQVLLASDDQPSGINYLVVRDGVTGNQPTQWHFWTLSEKLVTPGEAADRESALKDKPGAKVAPARELRGDRFTALGQFDMDVEYYVASPRDTPRYTLRYGTTGSAYGLGGFDEFQDLLHLQLPGDGDYFVVLFPRFSTEDVPEFTTLGQGKLIRISGRFGTDYCFLSRTPCDVKAEDIFLKGTAGAVQDRPSGLALILASPGEVSYRDYGVASPVPVTVRMAPYGLSLHFPEASPGGQVTLRLPGAWELTRGAAGASLTRKKERHTLAVPAGITVVELIRK